MHVLIKRQAPVISCNNTFAYICTQHNTHSHTHHHLGWISFDNILCRIMACHEQGQMVTNACCKVPTDVAVCALIEVQSHGHAIFAADLKGPAVNYPYTEQLLEFDQCKPVCQVDASLSLPTFRHQLCLRHGRRDCRTTLTSSSQSLCCGG